jgi:hypothetical protein
MREREAPIDITTSHSNVVVAHVESTVGSRESPDRATRSAQRAHTRVLLEPEFRNLVEQASPFIGKRRD